MQVIEASQQVPLTFLLKEEATFANYYQGRNENLLACLKALVAANGEQFIFIHAAQGMGRTHLLQACCHLAGTKNLSAVYLPMQMRHELAPEIVEDLELVDLVCIDDIDAIAGDAVWEEALFHLYNRVMASATRLVVAARHAPSEIAIELADLKSRLNHGVVFSIHELSDADKIAALQHRADQRGMVLSTEVCQFLLRRCTRSTSSLFELFDKLDTASLAEQRRLTIPFVKSVLGI